jgi:hypothetical protein
MHIRSAQPFLSTEFLGKDPGQVHYKKDWLMCSHGAGCGVMAPRMCVADWLAHTGCT